MFNIKLVVAYDGARYFGWQKTKDGPSIEGELEKVLKRTLQEEIYLQAASRTDRGVHAKGQIVNFITQKLPDLKKLERSLNQLLPKDIVILETSQERDDFHPTVDAKGKEYQYEVYTGGILLPQKRHYVWHYPYEVSLEKMVAAKDAFLGKKDFTSFTQKPLKSCPKKTEDNFCEIFQIEIHEFAPKSFRLHLIGNKFLYKMARTIVGTLIFAGRGKILPQDLAAIFLAKDRSLAGITAPAHGLFLATVFY